MSSPIDPTSPESAAEADKTSEPAEAVTAASSNPSPEGSDSPVGEASAGAADAEDADEGDEEAGDTEAAASQGGEAAGTEGKKKRKRRKKKSPAAAAQSRASDRAPFRVGEEVLGKVTAVLDCAIMVDLSGKALAIFDRSEMAADDLVPVVGDKFVARVHHDGMRGGLVVLTRKPLREDEAKPLIEQASKDGTLVDGLVTGVIKGGVEVDLAGLRAFAPASGMDLHPGNANFAGLVGQRMKFKVIQFEKGGRDVVVTRRPMLEQEAHERRKSALTLLSEGQVLKGVVRTVVDWGVFVALPEAENLEGLVHQSEASHDQRARMVDLFKPGDAIDVKIAKIDEKGKIWLSRKALVEDPWASIKDKYPAGSRHKGIVKQLEPFGAFIELEQGLDGLLHVADLSFERIEHPNEKLKEGEELEVIVHHFDSKNRKLALHPAPEGARAEEAPQKIVKNADVKAEVMKVEQAGVVMRVLGVTGRTARGFMPAGQTGTARGTDLRKEFKPGAILDVRVVDLDPRRGEPKLSVRAFHEEEERRAHREYRKKLKAEANFGTLGDLLRSKLGGQ